MGELRKTKKEPSQPIRFGYAGTRWESGKRTLLRLSRRSAYSSSTSCSRGLQAGAWLEGGGGSAMIFSDPSS